MPETTKDRKLSRLKLRGDQILSLQTDKLPEPPPEMMKLPGVAAWWQAMRLYREREMQSFHRLVNNLDSPSVVDGGGP